MRRLILGAVAAAVLVATVAGIEPARAVGPLDNPVDLAEAIRLEQLMDQHIYNGQVYEIEYNDDTRTVGQVAQLTDFTDSALWTGTYLAAQAFRYQVAKKKLTQPLSAADQAFWQGEKAAALARAKPLVAQYHVLANISGTWREKFKLSYTPPPSPEEIRDTKVSFGGGVINGTPGLLMRSCIPDSAPAWQRWPEPKDSVYGPFEFEGVTYHCEDATSRDAYAGATFGMITAFDLFGADDPAMRRQLGTDLLRLANFALEHLWSTPRPHGKIDLNNDLGGFFSPLFLYTPLAQLNLAQIARHVSTVLGIANERSKWNAVWLLELLTQGPLVGPVALQNSSEPDASYFKFNLEWLTGFDTMRLEPSAGSRRLLATGLAAMDATTGDDVNAHFEAITYALTGQPSRLQDAITHLRQWKQWRARYEGLDQSALNSDRCDVPGGLTCLTRTQSRVTLPTPVGPQSLLVNVPNLLALDPAAILAAKNCHEPNRYARDNCRSATVLPVAERVPTDFLWQRSPFQLDADRSRRHESQGIDYLLPYWMLRYYTEVAPPRSEPFPAWPGPSFS